MGIFDGVSKHDGVSYTSDLFGSVKAPAGKENKKPTVMNEDARKQRMEAGKKQIELAKANESRWKLGMESSTTFPGMRRQNLVPQSNPTNIRLTPTQLGSEINKARNVFMESLTNALFVGAINTINCEACPIDSEIKSKTDYKRLTYEICLSMFQDVRESKDFDKVVSEGKVPGFVGELWDLARESANIETKMRFNYNRILEGAGYESAKVQDYLNHELENITLTHESVNTYFQDMMGIILLEAGDVMEEIKGKVNAEIDNYKKSAEKIADIKKSVKEKLDDADSVPGTNGQPDDKSGDDAGAGGDDGNNPPPEGGDGNTPDSGAENSDQNGSDSASTDANGDGEGKDPEGGDNPADNTDPEEKQKDEMGSGDPNANQEGDDILNNQEKVREISPKITQEIEDASTFATNWSHTFNTGDEKFESMRKRFSQEFTQALNDGNLDKVDEIQANVNATKARIDEINASSNDKYHDVAARYAELGSQIKFELGQKIKNVTKVAEESRTTFENLVLGIAKRKIGSGVATYEDGFGIGYEHAKAALDEATINQTALETFNTLRLIDASNPNDKQSIQDFMQSLRK